MAERGRRIFAANGCVYCHSQQVRADYAASDIERKWGVRRSAPRDYIFDRPAMLGKMRLGPDLSNIGKRAPAEEASPTPTPAPNTSPSSSPAASPAPAAGSSPAAPPATSAASPGPSPSASAAAWPDKAVASNSPAPAPTKATSPVAPPAPVPAGPDTAAGTQGAPPQYSAAWHHLHLYSPRSLIRDSNMPAYHFLYQERPISGERSADALKLTGTDAPPEGSEVVPTYDAKCLVAYLMSLDQSHELKEAKLTAPASSPAPAKEAK
jgi:cytochrome c oxidase cbb3-type subunit 2